MEKLINPEGNEVVILKGPVEFTDEIRKEMKDDWSQYAGMDIDDHEFTDGNWYYVEVTKVIDGPNNVGQKTWWHEAELF